MPQSNPQSPNQKINTAEVKAAIHEICDKRGVPVVRSSDIADLEWVQVKRQAINNHLKDLAEQGEVNVIKAGPSGKVWYIPDDKEPEGHVDVSAIEWESVEPEDIPDELVKARPEVEDLTFWENMRKNWGTAAGVSSFIMILGSGLLVLAEYSPIVLFDYQLWGLLLIGGSLITAGAALAVVMIAKIGQSLEDVGLFPLLRAKLAAGRTRLLRYLNKRIPDVDEDDDRAE